MARRSDHNREELYELALSAAINIVEAEGFRALKARHVAERIGYSAGTLYNIFKNLDELIIHLNGRTLDELQAEISAVTLSGDALRDITSLVDVYLTYLEAHPNLWMALFDYKLPEGMPVPDWFALKVSMGLGIIETALAPLFVGAEPDASQNTARTF